jgi:hypothetical protein
MALHTYSHGPYLTKDFPFFFSSLSVHWSVHISIEAKLHLYMIHFRRCYFMVYNVLHVVCGLE